MFIRELPTTYKNILILICGALILWILYTISAAIAPFLLSIVLAYILNPVIRFLERYRIPRLYGVVILYIVASIACVLVVIPITLNIFSEGHDLLVRVSNLNVTNLSVQYKAQANSIADQYSHNPWLKNYLDLYLSNEKMHELAAKGVVLLKDLLIQLFNKVVGFTLRAFSSLVGLLFIPLLAFYLLVDLDLFYERGLMLVPPIYRDSFIRISKEIDIVLSGYLRGQILDCIIFGSLMTFGLWMTDLNFFDLIGPFSGIANMVPYLGSLSTIFMGALVAISQFGLNQALLSFAIKFVIVLCIVQGIDGFILQPKIIGENAGLHPLVVMFVMVIGASIFGFLGMLLAIPVSAILKVLFRELYHELYDQS